MTKLPFTKASFSDVSGTSLQGYVTVSYDRLVEVFGEPTPGQDKVQVEWLLRFADGTIATIYDYKDSTPPEEITEWNVGGDGRRHPVEKVQDALGWPIPSAVTLHRG